MGRWQEDTGAVCSRAERDVLKGARGTAGLGEMHLGPVRRQTDAQIPGTGGLCFTVRNQVLLMDILLCIRCGPGAGIQQRRGQVSSCLQTVQVHLSQILC